MKILEDIKNFWAYLTFVDIFFFVAIIVLLILVVTLIYFIKINKEEEDEHIVPKDGETKNKDDLENEILNLIENAKEEDDLKVTSNNTNPEEYSDEDEPLIDLEGLTKKLENQKNTDEASITAYEKDQEEKAIISYDELLRKKNNYAINYEKEEVLDDLVVKKVDLNDLVNKNVVDKVKEVRVISYQKEEAFLNALKELNRMLN